MILQLIRGRTGATDLQALRQALAGAHPKHWHLGSRGGGDGDALDVLIVAAWDSPEAATSSDDRSTSPWRLAQGLVTSAHMQHFEVDESLRRQSGDPPIAIRVATGRFSSPGADIEMQELLRRRMPVLGDEMCEAYVGRRLDGLAIEVTFVSLWRRRPDDWALEAPLWPDIALRYDSFVVEVYEAAG